MGRHLLTPNTPVHLDHDHDHDHTEKDWPVSAPRSTFRVAALVTSKRTRNRRMATDYGLRARQLLRYAAADPAQPHADTITDEHVRRARFLQPLYDPAANGEEDEERWPAQWAESVKSLRGFVTCRPWKDATEGYLAAVEERKEDEAGEKDFAAAEDQEQPSGEPASGPQQPDNEAAQTAADLLNLSGLGSVLNLSGMGTVAPQTTPVKPAPPAPRRPRHIQTQTQQTPALASLGGGSRLPVSTTLLPGARPLMAGGGRGAPKPLTPGREIVTTDLDSPLGETAATVTHLSPRLGDTGRDTAHPLNTGLGPAVQDTVTFDPFPRIGETRRDTTNPSPAGGRYTSPKPFPFIEQTAPVPGAFPGIGNTATVPGAFPDFGETQDTPAALFSTSPNMFGPGGRERNRANGRGRSRSVSPKGGNNPVIGGGFTEEEMERFRAWVAREERKKAREAAGK
ncbi:hypothetical protein GQ607_015663 [Colletotrichum asianum]|uniref:Uncharacterized protein n=1 Tax=Colletotrichum asianum TaxID=702518 RepID=A0A8H3W0U3_9PEZI|nr:hypothetical protein GQ607_015663 [Colletotrichum asianum]